ARATGEGDRGRDAGELSVHARFHQLSDVGDMDGEPVEQELRGPAIEADHGEAWSVGHQINSLTIGCRHGKEPGRTRPRSEVPSCYQGPQNRDQAGTIAADEAPTSGLVL